MRRFLFVITAMLLIVQGLWAQHVTPEQAKEKASQFLKANYARTGGKRSAPAVSELKTAVVFDAKDKKGLPYLYAVTDSRQSGFVLVSGDERFKAVLGYSDNSTFDEHNMPDNMRVFLQGYIDEMKYLESINYQPTKAAPRRSMSNVGVLMTTTWNQRAPYNNQCPLDNSQRSATGCVATAMAQVVNYHIQNDHGPAATIAEIPGYTIPNTTITVSAIPSGTAIPSKDLLLNSYANNAGTDAQKTAVAQLMLYCGTSVQMKYSSGSSGTQTAYVANALVNYFGFDNTTRFVRRIDYSYADWVNLIYNEVAASRPVVLGAGRAAGGHAFVADGFDATNTLFHINWGWGGYLDDYFALSVLNPDDAGQTGAAAGTDGYTIDQQAIVGIQHVGASGTTDPASLTMDSYRVEGTDIHFSAGNLTGTTNSFDIGVGVYDGSSITLFKLIASQSISTGSAFPDVSASAICADFANQTRKLIPMSRVSETSTWIPGADPDINYFSAVYDAYGVPTLTAHPAPNFQNTTFDISAPVFVNTLQNTNVTFTNNGEEYYGMAYFFVSTDANNKGNYVAKRGLGAPTGVPTTVDFKWTPTSATTYYIWATTDEAGTNVIGSTSVTATTDASLAGKTLAIVDYQLEGQDDQSFQIDGNGTRSIDVYGSKLKGKVTIKNLSASSYDYGSKYITLTYKKWNGSQFVMLNSDYDIGVMSPVLAGGAEYTFDVNRDGLESSLYQISLTTFEIDANHYVQNRTELDERYTINLKPIGMTIASASDWETFCSNVNNGTTYSGKLVKLTADITTSTRMNGNFKGVFDGGGHTLNITISGGSWNMAPFPVISGATIKNLTVTGSVTNTSDFTGGLVGEATGNNNLIENCVVNTDVTGDMRIGGVVGQLTGSLTIKDVVYGGTITHTGSYAGGFIGCYNNTDKSLTMTNCLFKGTYSGPSPFHPIGMKYNTSSTFSTLSCTNCFYTVNPQNNPDAGVVIADGTKVSQLTLGQGVSILSGSTCSFLNEVYHYGTVTLGYNDPEAVVTYSLDGTPLPGNSFTISKDNAAFNDGTATITAGYSFTISYNLDGGTVATPNPTTYTSASSDITLNNPTREGWTFTGWTGTGLNGAQMTVTITQGSTGHRHYTATWTADELDTDASGAFVINNKNDWDRFCSRVTSGANSYEGATVKLTGNVGTAENPVTTMAGADVTHTFKGTFDGAGYTLTVNYNTAAGCTAPFRFVDGATIRNLHVAGTITSSEQFASGFVGEVVYGHDVNITNCRSSVAINSNVSSSNNGYGTHGGFVGAAKYIVNITGCIFDGSFTTTNGTHSCGGFIGYSWVGSEHMHISNSVLAPTSVSSGMLDKTFVRYGSGTPDITNCYYIPVTNMPTNQGKEAHTISAGTNVTSLAISSVPTTEYNVSGIKVYGDDKGIMYGSTLYAANNDAVELALTGTGRQPGYQLSYSASAGSITAQTPTSASLTMPNEDVTISAANAPYSITADYIDDSGKPASETAHVINGSDRTLSTGWYVVNEDVKITPYEVSWSNPNSSGSEHTNRITINGDVKLILADGATLDATNGQYWIENPGMYLDSNGGIHVPEDNSLTIYRQSGGTGTLNVASNSNDRAGIGGGYPGYSNDNAGTITIYGGIINATTYGTSIGGRQGAHGGTVNIHGGTVTAVCGMGAAIGGGSNCTGFTVNIYGGIVNATGGTEAAAIGGGSCGSSGTVNISGGIVTATARFSDYIKDYEGYGIGGGKNSTSPTVVNLSLTNSSDRITATSYNGTVNILTNLAATDGTTWNSGSAINPTPDGKTLVLPSKLILLVDNADNSSVISSNDGVTGNVALKDRSLTTDGYWNTLCLPFSMSAAQIADSPLADYTIKELNTTGTNLTDGVLTLNFTDATSIVAGKPYIVKNTLYTATAGSAGVSEGEGYASLVDANLNTKWHSDASGKDNGKWYCEFHTSKPVTATSYTLTTADNTVETSGYMNPTKWKLLRWDEYSNNWEELDTRDATQNSGDELPVADKESKSYSISSTRSNQYYRFEVSDVTSGSSMQLQELRLTVNNWNNVTNPLFTGVTVSNTAEQEIEATDGNVKFIGTYSPFNIDDNNKNSILYIASGNRIGYSATNRTLKSCRAYFLVKPNGDAPGARMINLDFGNGETTSIELVTIDENRTAVKGIYTLDGRKLNSLPSSKGVYIVNGTKVVVK